MGVTGNNKKANTWGRIWRYQLSDTLQIQFNISQGQTDVNSMQYIMSNLNIDMKRYVIVIAFRFKNTR